MAFSTGTSAVTLAAVLQDHEEEVLTRWVHLLGAGSMRRDLISESELRTESARFLSAFAAAVAKGNLSNIQGPEWEDVRTNLSALSSTRALKGFSASETATFVFSLKQPLFEALQKRITDGVELATQLWSVSTLLDRLGLFTTDVFQKSRERVIQSQQQEMLELSTPVVELFDGVLALPLIGTLDSARTQVVMENLLNRIVSSGSSIAILDITGVPTVDTMVAQHLLKTVAAARLMGADCIISGIRPQIAQTIVNLGVELRDVTTKASLGSALTVALERVGYTVTRNNPAAAQ